MPTQSVIVYRSQSEAAMDQFLYNGPGSSLIIWLGSAFLAFVLAALLAGKWRRLDSSPYLFACVVLTLSAPIYRGLIWCLTYL